MDRENSEKKGQYSSGITGNESRSVSGMVLQNMDEMISHAKKYGDIILLLQKKVANISEKILSMEKRLDSVLHAKDHDSQYHDKGHTQSDQSSDSDCSYSDSSGKVPLPKDHGLSSSHTKSVKHLPPTHTPLSQRQTLDLQQTMHGSSHSPKGPYSDFDTSWSGGISKEVDRKPELMKRRHQHSAGSITSPESFSPFSPRSRMVKSEGPKKKHSSTSPLLSLSPMPPPPIATSGLSFRDKIVQMILKKYDSNLITQELMSVTSKKFEELDASSLRVILPFISEGTGDFPSSLCFEKDLAVRKKGVNPVRFNYYRFVLVYFFESAVRFRRLFEESSRVQRAAAKVWSDFTGIHDKCESQKQELAEAVASLLDCSPALSNEEVVSLLIFMSQFD
ncbi:hypothetical protein ADUPG1_012452 [Aduncisulcus paluster]|uniref:FRIGIDA-like protein n=1 Tax=Aduncisulcus paluster TaxID=2918883 RepID=A0ABQ5JZJ4_9EUKA|nr:hypothetical protein ADUPG1_012452 [Aduncisulcus paluster]